MYIWMTIFGEKAREGAGLLFACKVGRTGSCIAELRRERKHKTTTKDDDACAMAVKWRCEQRRIAACVCTLMASYCSKTI